MSTVNITDFSRGMANDYTKGGVGEFSVSKQFDILTYPQRLQPLRGLNTDTTGTNMGNIIVASDGLMYGLGLQTGANPTYGTIWKKAGYGVSDAWTERSSGSASALPSATNGGYSFFIEYKSAGDTKKFFYPGTNEINRMDSGGTTSTSHALTFTTIGQGIVHPKDDTLYIPYDNKIAKFSGTSLTAAILTLPAQYRIYSLSHWGNYLAIACTSSANGSGIITSVVFLWDRDTSNSLPNESILWGSGSLRVLNNLGGTLVGISQMAANSTYPTQDLNKIQVKIWNGGPEPVAAKELVATRLTTTAPSCAINDRVNFIYNDRLYFSVDVVNGGSAPAYYGLWSFGKNRNGLWTTTIEYIPNADQSVLAAAIAGDFVSLVRNTVGTVMSSVVSDVLGDIYANTSIYESVFNPEMAEGDKAMKKQLVTVYATYLPLPTAGQVVMKYRVDSLVNGSWTTTFTDSTDNSVRSETLVSSAGDQFTSGTNYEFRLESTGGAIITGWGYKYDDLDTNI